jgi:hypothetical protein
MHIKKFWSVVPQAEHIVLRVELELVVVLGEVAVREQRGRLIRPHGSKAAPQYPPPLVHRTEKDRSRPKGVVGG